MAGRGVDIVLGGNPPDLKKAEEIKKLGGLHVIGTERHEARRIDNQLRGRSGRQGDPGSSQFFLSLEDDLMRVFGGERLKILITKLNLPDDQPIEANLISKALEDAQSRIEGMNFDLRKHVLEYDDVINKHREVIYKKRKEVLEKAQKNELKPLILEMIKRAGLKEEDYEKKEKEVGKENMRNAEKVVYLRILDMLWMGHLDNMEYLKDSVKLRAYGQKNPLIEYKKEGHQMFKKLLDALEKTFTYTIMSVKVGPVSGAPAKRYVPHSSSQKKVGRNDPCPCGSKKKYKKCCMNK
jgi:preprotein translocase subunit SecA